MHSDDDLLPIWTPTPAERDLLTALTETAYAAVNELGLYADEHERTGDPAARLLAYGPWRRAVVAVAEVARWSTDSTPDRHTLAGLRAGLHACEAALRYGSAAPAPLAKAVA
jgi:hypothetical protein